MDVDFGVANLDGKYVCLTRAPSFLVVDGKADPFLQTDQLYRV
jgi:hypothetical protein